MQADDSEQIPSPTPLSWGQWLVRSLIAVVIVAILGLWRPLWIKPPLVAYSFILYLLLTWAGVIILVVAAFRQPTGRRSVGVLGVVVNVLLSLVLSVFVGISFLFGPKECSKAATTPPLEQYSCSSSFFYSSTSLTFISVTGIPLMLLIRTSSSMSGFN